MSNRVKWEYRIREVTHGQVKDKHALGKVDPDQETLIEQKINELAHAGWELVPMTIQFAAGSVALVFRRPEEEHSIVDEIMEGLGQG